MLWLQIAGCVLPTLECEQEGAARNPTDYSQNSLPTWKHSSVGDPAVASTGAGAFYRQPSAT